MKKTLIVVFLLSNFLIHAQNKSIFEEIKGTIGKEVLRKADSALNILPVTITAESCERSAGGKHDFYSEGDYWWQNPDDPNGPYIQRDGQTNPANFVVHRRVMVGFSQIIGSLASAYVLTKDEKYVKASMVHLKAWFVDTATRMNPSLLYAQAIKGKATGRGIGIIDMIQMIEVAQGTMVMQKAKCVNQRDLLKIKAWFSEYLQWVTTHQYGIDEREAKNNHGTCWAMQVAVFAKLTDNQALMQYCRERFKQVLLPNQLEKDGSLPLELKRTKPYGYSLFNLDALCTVAHVLSNKGENLWDFQFSDGQNLQKAIQFMYPFIANKDKWTFAKDVMYWEELPVAQPALIFGFCKYKNQAWLETWKRLEHFPTTEEVIRNLPVRNPLIWIN